MNMVFRDVFKILLSVLLCLAALSCRQLQVALVVGPVSEAELRLEVLE